MLNKKRFQFSASLAALMAVGATSVAFAAPGDPPSMIGEVVVKVRPGMSEAEIAALAETANCSVVHPIQYCPGYYLFRLKTASARSRDTIGIQAAVAQAQSSSAELDAAVATLRTNQGVGAEPNYIRKPDYIRKPSVRSRGNVTAMAPTPKVLWSQQNTAKPSVRRGRATAPPSSNTATPDDPLFGQQYGLTLIRMPEAYAALSSARTVVVGVADTGIDIGHPDFVRPDGTNVVVGGQNFYTDNQASFQDGAGHGTHVSGTIAAVTNNGTGVSSVAGWARGGVDVRIRMARVFGNDDAGAPLDVISAGEGYLIDQNVDVINLSLGGGGFSAAQIELDTINRALNANITVVAAAGNESTNNSNLPNFPSDIPGVVKVTSVGRDKVLASYSNYGGPVTVAAPGGDIGVNGDPGIISTWPRAVAKESPQLGLPVGYDSIQGTSMACPHVAGVAALLIAAGAPRVPATILTTLHDSAQTLPNDVGGVKYGGGLLDAYSALLPFLDPSFSITFTDDTTTSSTSTTAVDLGTIYTNQGIAFSVTAVGVGRQPATGGARLQIYTSAYPSTLVREYLLNSTGGFTIPAVPVGLPISTPVMATIPGSGQPIADLPPGRYRIELRLGDTVVGTRFVTVVTRTQASGRTLFSVPFQTRIANPTAPEQALFGLGSTFSLARYNPLRLPGELDYSLFQSAANGRRDTGASFSATAAGGTPLVYDTSNPTVSVAPVGLGYWLNLNSSVTLNTVGNPVSGAVAIRLFASGGGWNQIGAPYVSPTAWATSTVRTTDGSSYSLGEAIAQGIIASSLVGYRNGDYFYQVYPEGTLDPFNGYWVRAFRDCTLIVAPTGATSRAVRPAVPTRQFSGLPQIAGWRGRLSASVAGDIDGQNYFGQARGAKAETDILDIAKPPSGAGHAYVRFVTPDGTSRSISNAFDMRPADTGRQEWKAAISTDRTNADVTVTWDNLGALPKRMGLTLTDPATGHSVDMRARSSYTFRSGEAGSTRELKIALDPRQSMGALAITGVAVTGGSRVVNGGSGLSVRFNTTRAANIVGTVKTVGGRVVSLLTGSSRSEGTTAATLRWDGKTSGSPAPAGPYLLEITARTDDGQTATYTQPFLSNQ